MSMGSKISTLKPGLTLVELLIAAVIMGVIVLFAGSILVGHLKLFNRGSSLINLTSANKIALDEIVNEVRESQSVVNTCTPCGSDATSASVLILRLWPLDSSDDPVDNGAYDYILYKRDSSDNTKIRKIVYPDASSNRPASNKIIGTDTNSLTFTYNNADPSLATNVTIKVKNTAVVNGANQEVEREAKAVLRNK